MPSNPCTDSRSSQPADQTTSVEERGAVKASATLRLTGRMRDGGDRLPHHQPGHRSHQCTFHLVGVRSTRAISILKMRRVGMIAVAIESPSARNMSVSGVAETTVPITCRKPRIVYRSYGSARSGERIFTREPATIGQSATGTSCAPDGAPARRIEHAVAATSAARQISRMKRIVSSYAESPASSRVNPWSIFKP